MRNDYIQWLCISVQIDYLPQLVQHTSLGRGRWQQRLTQGLGHRPPVQQYVGACARAEGRHPLSSNHQVGAAITLDVGIHVLPASVGCPALAMHGHCEQDCGVERQKQHLKHKTNYNREVFNI